MTKLECILIEIALVVITLVAILAMGAVVGWYIVEARR